MKNEIFTNLQHDLKPKKYRDVLGFLAFGLGIFLLASLLSYNPSDASWNVVGNQTSNTFGQLGALFADFSYQSFGYASYFLCGLCFYFGLMMFFQRSYQLKWNHFFGYMLLALALPSLSFLLQGSTPQTKQQISWGGIWGQWTFEQSQQVLPASVTIVILCFVSFVGLLWTQRISMYGLLKQFFQRLGFFQPKKQNRPQANPLLKTETTNDNLPHLELDQSWFKTTPPNEAGSFGLHDTENEEDIALLEIHAPHTATQKTHPEQRKSELPVMDSEEVAFLEEVPQLLSHSQEHISHVDELKQQCKEPLKKDSNPDYAKDFTSEKKAVHDSFDELEADFQKLAESEVEQEKELITVDGSVQQQPVARLQSPRQSPIVEQKVPTAIRNLPSTSKLHPKEVTVQVKKLPENFHFSSDHGQEYPDSNPFGDLGDSVANELSLPAESFEETSRQQGFTSSWEEQHHSFELDQANSLLSEEEYHDSLVVAPTNNEQQQKISWEENEPFAFPNFSPAIPEQEIKREVALSTSLSHEMLEAICFDTAPEEQEPQNNTTQKEEMSVSDSSIEIDLEKVSFFDTQEEIKRRKASGSPRFDFFYDSAEEIDAVLESLEKDEHDEVEIKSVRFEIDESSLRELEQKDLATPQISPRISPQISKHAGEAEQREHITSRETPSAKQPSFEKTTSKEELSVEKDSSQKSEEAPSLEPVYFQPEEILEELAKEDDYIEQIISSEPELYTPASFEVEALQNIVEPMITPESPRQEDELPEEVQENVEEEVQKNIAITNEIPVEKKEQDISFETNSSQIEPATSTYVPEPPKQEEPNIRFHEGEQPNYLMLDSRPPEEVEDEVLETNTYVPTVEELLRRKEEKEVERQQQPVEEQKSIRRSIQQIKAPEKAPWEIHGYVPPSLEILDYEEKEDEYDEEVEKALQENADVLERTLESFNVRGKVTGILSGPVITMYEYLPEPGIKVSKVAGLSDDIAMALSALQVRVIAPIPGKGVIGIEIPNKGREMVFLKEILANPIFSETDYKLPMAMGKTTSGEPYVANLAKMPHLLIAGTTGSGKSVGVNAMLCSLLYNSSPEDVRFLMIDPKMLELSIYEGIPHLLLPVVTDPKKAAVALNWAVSEMERRYGLMAASGVRNLEKYNKLIEKRIKVRDMMRRREQLIDEGKREMMMSEDEDRLWEEAEEEFDFEELQAQEEQGAYYEKLPYIVIIIDELADLMMVAAKEVEVSIARLAQMARAAGLHLMVATQRPSVDVLTGVIKANFPTRLAYQLKSKFDSRTILDAIGAEKLLGMGDMLFVPPTSSIPTRLHAPFVSEEEIHLIVKHLKKQGTPNYNTSILEGSLSGDCEDEGFDPLYDEALVIIDETRKASASVLQKKLKIGYSRASKILEQLEEEGVIGAARGNRPREILLPPRKDDYKLF